MKAFHKNILCLSLLAALTVLTACQQDEPYGWADDAGPIKFGGWLRKNDKVKSRAEGLDSAYITTDPFNMDFYIQLNCEDAEAPDGNYV